MYYVDEAMTEIGSVHSVVSHLSKELRPCNAWVAFVASTLISVASLLASRILVVLYIVESGADGVVVPSSGTKCGGCKSTSSSTLLGVGGGGVLVLLLGEPVLIFIEKARLIDNSDLVLISKTGWQHEHAIGEGLFREKRKRSENTSDIFLALETRTC